MALEVEDVAPPLEPDERHWDFRSRRTLHRHREILLLSSDLDGVDKLSRVLHARDVNDFGNVSGMVEFDVNKIQRDFGPNQNLSQMKATFLWIYLIIDQKLV